VLAFYGELDERVTASKGQAADALRRGGLLHEIVVEPGADHAFFNDSGPRYNAAAAVDAWQRLLGWLGQHIG
ncbi:dienelactone hydrolase family protein, partial [Mycobacteroides abscessus]